MSIETTPERLLTVQEMCELLKVPKSYVHCLTHSKSVPHFRIDGHLRFKQSHIKEWLESQEVRSNVGLQTGIQERNYMVCLLNLARR